MLSSERGEYDIASSDLGGASTLLTAMRAMTSGQGLEPEQVWEDPNLAPSPFGSDPSTASIGFVDGQPAGSASPLTWAQASYARLALDLSARRNLETPDIVTDRYVTHGMPGSLPLTVTSPASGASIDGSTVTVTGTTTAGARVVAEAFGRNRWNRRDRLDQADSIRGLVAVAADRVREHDDHRDRDARPQHRLQPAERDQRRAARARPC